MNPIAAAKEYQSVKIQGDVTGASEHRLVSLLFDGALERLSSAEHAIHENQSAKKGQLISGALAIIDSLRASLDMKAGGDIAADLYSLYTYMESRLLEANVTSDVAIIQEVKGLLKELQAGWNQMSLTNGETQDAIRDET